MRTRPEGNQVFYRVENDHVASLVRDTIHHAEHASDGLPAHHRSAGSSITPNGRSEQSR